MSSIQKELLSIVNTTAPFIDGAMHERIFGIHNEILTPTEFYHVKSLLTEVKKSNQLDSQYGSPIYTMRKSLDYGETGYLEFVVMTDPDENGHFYLGSQYKIKPHQMTAFNGTSSISKIYKDEEGQWISAASPIYDNNKKIIGILQTDRNISHFSRLSLKQAFTIFWGALVSVILGSIMATFFSKRIVKPIKSLVLGMTKIGKKDFSTNLDFHREDEIGQLGDAFNIASAQLEKLTFEMQELVKEKTQNLKEINSKIETMKNYYENLIQSLQDAVISVNSTEQISQINAAGTTLSGYDEQELIGKSVSTILSVPFHSLSSSPEEHCILSKSGKKIPVLITLSKIGNIQDASLGAYVITAKNIEKLKALEVKLHQAAKLESIGTLSAGVAHEINTPIQYVGDNLSFFSESYSSLLKLLKQYKKQNLDNEWIKKIKKEIQYNYLIKELPLAINGALEGIQRVRKIVHSMKDFSHLEMKETKELSDINKAIESTINISKNEWKYHSDIKVHFNSNIPEIYCFIGDIKQVVLNIIINASHAVEDAINKKIITKGIIQIKTDLKDGMVSIDISDNGIGIPQSIKEKIFDPFFTTKPVGKGTGQGLSLAYRAIVTKHKGTLSVESKPNLGTTFTIHIPAIY
ncbi:MAG: HAMP domain-containing protein [Candidatus Margulisbacteria bacterium]|nr:HAMP domain-containing protein [Candidatus Margulisiibacteriota bacterium]